MPGFVKWTAIVLTCPNKDWTQILHRELEIRQAKGLIEKDVFLLTVEDPKADVGSGGATINALLTVAEYISAQRGFNVLNSDVLQDSKILILHNGRGYAYDSCGRSFTCLPAQYTKTGHESLVTMLDTLIKIITEKVAVQSGSGVWVSSTDMILQIPHDAKIKWTECDACAITLPANLNYCRQHGVYKLTDQGYVEDILYKETVEKLEKCEMSDGNLPMVCGLVYFSCAVAEVLLECYAHPPLDACTYFGVDSGEPPIKLSLFFDVMLPMCSGVNARDFRSGARSGSYGKSVAVGDIKTMRAARTLLWDKLNKFKIKACLIDDGTCIYPHTIQEHKKNILDRQMYDCFTPGQLQWSNVTHSHIKNPAAVDESSVVINSILDKNVEVGSKCVICHSKLHGKVKVKTDSFISGLVIDPEYTESIQFAESIIVQGYNIYVPFLARSLYVLTTHGRFDNIEMPSWKTVASICNDPWVYMLNRTGILREDLWGKHVENDDQTIQTAQLFPVFHAQEKVGLTEILWLQGEVTDDEDNNILRRWRESYRLSLRDIQRLIDLEKEFKTRSELYYGVWEEDVWQALLHQENKGFRALYNSAVMDGYTDKIFSVLDKVAETSHDQLQAGIAARTLANIADVLGCMAGPKGGLRSGPAANKSWATAFDLLEKGELREGVKALAAERGKWLDRPDKLIRAARHYEGAAQILIRHAVMTAKQFFKITDSQLVPIGQWTLAECPARIDVSGGWSDTPPITFEHGGAVTTVGLLVDGKRPIGAKSRRIKQCRIVLVLHGTNDQKEIICKEKADLADYYKPHSPGALLKAAFVCVNIIDLQSDVPLDEELASKYDGGFELHSWTNLPQGSGLGTSSILAGAVLASLLKTAGKSCSMDGLLHAVLYVEQLLTTGGGWQDQIGGLTGGFKLGVSAASLPLFVEAKDLSVGEEVVQAFNDRLVLIYTGKTRLARNLLQDVVRNWYARNPQILETEDNLVKLGEGCAKHFQNGDMHSVGRCMDEYWKMKKLMAPGCEPEVVTRLMTSVRPHALGMCMAGAGGGGFMYVLAKDRESQLNIRNIIASEEFGGAKVYEAEVDMQGLTITVIEADDESQQSTAMSELDEDMDDYYNQPETLLDDVPNQSTTTPQSMEAGNQNTENGNQSTGNAQQTTCSEGLDGKQETGSANQSEQAGNQTTEIAGDQSTGSVQQTTGSEGQSRGEEATGGTSSALEEAERLLASIKSSRVNQDKVLESIMGKKADGSGDA